MNYFALLTVLAASLFGAGAINVTDHNKIMSCYVGTWAFYRPGEGKFDVEDIDPWLCTHGFYGFADLDNITWTIYAYDPWYDLAPGDCEPGYCNYDSYRRFVNLKSVNPNFVPMLSIGKIFWYLVKKAFTGYITLQVVGMLAQANTQSWLLILLRGPLSLKALSCTYKNLVLRGLIWIGNTLALVLAQMKIQTWPASALWWMNSRLH